MIIDYTLDCDIGYGSQSIVKRRFVHFRIASEAAALHGLVLVS